MVENGNGSKFRVSWGEKFADAGFSAIPNLLIDRGSELGITDAEFRAICQALRNGEEVPAWVVQALEGLPEGGHSNE